MDSVTRIRIAFALWKQRVRVEEIAKEEEGIVVGLAPVSRKIWSMSKSSQYLLLHAEWWRSYYHRIRAHESLRLRALGLKHHYRQRSPAMAAGLTDHLWRVGDILSLPLLPEGGSC